jgi:hypothetical protein
MAAITERENDRRLIVLVPGCLANNIDLAYKIHWMASAENAGVLYLVLADDEEQMLTIARNMATMKAVTRGRWLVVESRLVLAGQWFKTLREICRPGDIVVCQEEQQIATGFLRSTPAAAFLHDALDRPIRTVSHFYHPQRTQMLAWLRTFWVWAGFLLIIVVSTLVEIQLNRSVQGLAGMALIFLAVCVEGGALLAWNNLFS